MSLVKSKDTKLEVRFGKALRKLGYRFIKNSGNYFGKPDFVLKRFKTAIFIDSCFWHGCKKHLRLPSTRKLFWTTKILRNKQRDKEVTRYYERINWKVIRIWEHDLKNKNFKFNAKQIKKVIANQGSIKRNAKKSKNKS